jgi:hypothetical protein
MNPLTELGARNNRVVLYSRKMDMILAIVIWRAVGMAGNPLRDCLRVGHRRLQIIVGVAIVINTDY